MCESGRPMTIEERLDNHYKIIKDEQRRLDEIDARVKALEDSLKEHRDWHRVGGLIPKPTKEEHYDILHEGLKHMAGIDAKPAPVLNDGKAAPDTHLPFVTGLTAKPTPTDEELARTYYDKLMHHGKYRDLGTHADDKLLDILRQLIAEVRK